MRGDLNLVAACASFDWSRTDPQIVSGIPPPVKHISTPDVVRMPRRSLARLRVIPRDRSSQRQAGSAGAANGGPSLAPI